MWAYTDAHNKVVLHWQGIVFAAFNSFFSYGWLAWGATCRWDGCMLQGGAT